MLAGAFQLRLTEYEEDCPVPERATVVVPPVDELLEIFSCPVTDPAVVGSNKA